MSGNTYTAYKNTAYLTQVRNNVFHNSWMLNQPHFEIIHEAQCPGGATIPFLIDYAESTNAEVRTIGTPMPNPDTTSTVAAYFNKDYYHATSKVANITKQQLTVNYNGSLVPINPEQKSVEKAAKNLVDLIATTCLADLSTQVDSATAFSDASLTRATYSIASYESAVGGAQTIAILEDAIEYLEDVTYGPIDRSDLVIMMPRNQLTNHSRLVIGAQYRELNASADGNGAIDGGRTKRIKQFDDVDIMVVPDMTTTEILIVQKSAIKIFIHEDLRIVKKDLAEDADSDYLTMGLNLVNTNPKGCVKYTGVTA